MCAIIQRYGTVLYFESCMVVLFCQRNLGGLGSRHALEISKSIILKVLQINGLNRINTLMRCKVTKIIRNNKTSTTESMNDMNTQSMLRVGTMIRGIYRIESYLGLPEFGVMKR